MNNVHNLGTFLQKHARHRHCILHDGNCLFRSLSYIMHQTESRHAEIRAELVQFTLLNLNHFSGYCKPLTAEMHTRNMKNNCIWGTHVEIYALSLYLKIPVFVALDKGSGEFYWAICQVHLRNDEPLLFPSPSNNSLVLPANIRHIEVCHVNNNHYEVPVTADGSVSCIPPCIDDASTNASVLIVLS